MNFEDLYHKLPPVQKYDAVLEDIKKYNRADTVNMTEPEMNRFRHIAGPAYLTSQYYPKELTRFLGLGKETKDLIQGRGLADTLMDLKNNERGMNIGEVNRNLKNNQKTLFDYIFKTEIEPYRDR